MELKKYAQIMMKRLWLIILLPVATGLFSAYVSYYVLVPVYEANTTLYVINTPASAGSENYIDYSLLLAGESLVKDYRELVRSRAVTSVVIDQLKLKDMTSGQLASMISVDSKNETRIIEIGVQDTDPERAARIADTVSTVFVDKVVSLMKVQSVSIVDKAQIPAGPVAPSPVKNITIAVFLGLMAAVGIIFLMEYLDDTIKTAEDVEKYLGVSMLGSIPVMRG